MSHIADIRVHAFGDDALGDLDSVGVAAAISDGTISAREAVEAAIARIEKVEPHVNGVVHASWETALRDADLHDSSGTAGVFAGVPTLIKDNTDVAGMPTQHGSQAWVAGPAETDEPFTQQYRSTGSIVLGKSTLPEFGFSASTEFEGLAPTRNPWNTAYSSGASSGGAAALVAAGAVPFAHANDGGGSIRIPAAACGLVGLKMTRGRELIAKEARSLPVNIVSNGMVSRTVRDTAAFVAAIERYQPASRLPRVGHVEGPSDRRLRVGLILDSLVEPTDDETRAAVQGVADHLAANGHEVVEVPLPVGPEFAEHFAHYWSLLGFSLHRFGKRLMHPDFDRTRTDALTKGLARDFVRHAWRTPGAINGLKRSTAVYRQSFEDLDVVLSPVLAHTTPPLGHLSPEIGYDELFPRLMRYVSFTPANNAAGGPAISLPLAQTADGLPIGIHFSADHGDERTLLQLAYELESSLPFATIQR